MGYSSLKIKELKFVEDKGYVRNFTSRSWEGIGSNVSISCQTFSLIEWQYEEHFDCHNIKMMSSKNDVHIFYKT